MSWREIRSGIAPTAEDAARLAGPFGKALGDEGWTHLRMHEARFLYDWCRADPTLASVHRVCYNSLLTTNVQIARAEEKPSAEQQQARARLFGAFGRAAALIEKALGFYLVAGVEPLGGDDLDTGMAQVPRLLNLDQIDVWYRVDVYSRFEWRVYEVSARAAEPTLLDPATYTVYGEEMPRMDGRVYSRAQSIRSDVYDMLAAKVAATRVADAERARPTLVTQPVPESHDPLQVRSAIHASLDQRAPDADDGGALDRSPAVQAMAAHISALNCGRPSPQAAAAVTMTRGHFDQFALDTGKQYVAAHMPEAPIDVAVVRQAYLECVCLVFGVPMSMLSSGDASGHAKLNSETASPETAQIFRDAQRDRAKRFEQDVRAVCQFLNRVHDTEALIRPVMEKRVTKGKKRKEEPTKEEEAAMDEKDRITPAHLAKRTRWTVHVPSRERLENILLLASLGMLEDDAQRRLLADATQMELDAFKPHQKHTLDQQNMYDTYVYRNTRAAALPGCV
ncbi:MAG: hypothetical protein Q7V62_03705 [Actinomycetota bacterium]|nr:hypothetical protein [Actinomycetota bacterium]